jgi:zinc transport system substrate-binding protein
MRKRPLKKGLWIGSTALLIIFSLSGAAAADSPLSVCVVNYPLKYFAERIGGSHVEVLLPVPADVDPAYFMPSTADIGRCQQADLILLNGAGYAKWVRKVSLPRAKMVDTSRAFKERYLTAKEVTTHSHGAEGEHAHEALAFTTWLNFDLAAKQAEAILEALIRKRPQQKDLFRANYTSLGNDLLALDSRVKAVVSHNNSVPIIFSHPVYQYLEEGYGLNGQSVHWEPDQTPSSMQLGELEKLVETHPARWMVWEGVPVKPALAALEAKNIQSAVFDPCGNVPPEGDFLSVMHQNVLNLEAVFRE